MVLFGLFKIFFSFCLNIFDLFKNFFFSISAFLFLKESRGQAAITDAVFFLLIVSGLAVFLFSFNATYGNSVSERFSAKYSEDVAIDSIKTILYSSVSRSNKSLYSSDEDLFVDSFLALMKEDYTEDKELNDSTKLILANNIMKVLAPLAPAKDFMFLMYESSSLTDTPFFVLLHLTKPVENNAGKSHYDFVCSGPKQGRFTTKLSKFTSVLNSSEQYFTPIKLFETRNLGNNVQSQVRPEIDGVVLLLLWNGEPFCKLINDCDSEASSWNSEVFNPSDWGCKELILDSSSKMYSLERLSS